MAKVTGLSAILVLALAVPAAAQDGSNEQAKPEGRRPHRGMEFRKKILERFDANKDGQLDEAERKAAREAFEQRRGEFKAKAMEKFDANQDGRLDENERQAAKEAMKERMG